MQKIAELMQNLDLVWMNHAVLESLQDAWLYDDDEDSSSTGEFDVVSVAPANEHEQEGAANAAGGDQFPADE